MREYSQPDITEISGEKALDYILRRNPELKREEIETLLDTREEIR